MEKLRVGVVGAGAISGIYLQNMTGRFPYLDVRSICSAHFTSAAAKAEKFGLKACALEEMLNDPEIDMIVNLTPVGVHYEIVKAALEHGKHVFTEKTLTDDPETAAELVRLADEKGLRLGCAPETFMGAAYQTARRAIEQGMLGDIHSFAISATRCNDLLLSMFSFLRQPGAGILYDYAVYYVTALVYLLGPVVRAAGVVAAPYPTHVGVIPGKPDFGKPFASPNESQVSAILKLESGVTGTLHLDADTVMKDEAFFTVYGTKGMLRLTDPNGFGGDVVFVPTALDPGQPQEPVTLPPVSDLTDNCRGIGPSDMADAILHGRPHQTSMERALHVLRVLSAILSGGETGAFVDL